VSARTYFRVYVYACPEDQRTAVARLLREQEGLDYEYLDQGPEDKTEISLTEPLSTSEWNMDSSSNDLARKLIEAAPGASWRMWHDADCGRLGAFHACTPELGLFGPADCDSSGDVQLSASDLTEKLSALRGASGRAYREALEAAYGKPWRLDYDLHLARQRDGVS
jgi:hypothetical protein